MIFVLAFLFLYFCSVIYVSETIATNIKFQLILRTRSFYSQVWLKIIDNNYVRIMFIYHLFVDYGVSVN